MNVQVLMSTTNKTSLKEFNVQSRNIKGTFVVVNQFAKANTIDENEKGTLYSYDEKGLAKSRNHLLEHASGDIGVISDDDITFVDNYQQIIEDAYLLHPDADLITFNIQMGDQIIGSNKSFKYNFISLMSVVSCQITLRIKEVNTKHIRFLEHFGLGATFISGEENIFLNTCRKQGLKIVHVPQVICSHPKEETTGERWDKELVKSKGALSYALLGRKHGLFLFYFILFKHSCYKNQLSMLEFYKWYRVGIKEYKCLK